MLHLTEPGRLLTPKNMLKSQTLFYPSRNLAAGILIKSVTEITYLYYIQTSGYIASLYTMYVSLHIRDLSITF